MLTLAVAMMLQTTMPPAGPVGQPVPASRALARRLAEAGTLASLLPLMAARETEEIVASRPELAAADRAALRTEAARQAELIRDRLMDAEAAAFAAALSIEDLRVLVAAAESPAARRQRAAMPQVIVATMRAMDGVDFKRATLDAFCRRTGKACGAAPAAR